MREADITLVYVADDREFTEQVREYVKRRHDDVSVRTVRNAGAVFAQLEASDDVDCVVSDDALPGMDGLELLEAVRERWADLPFVLLTGEENEDVAADAIDAGATDYLLKGSSTVRHEALVNRVRNAVERHRARTELERASRGTGAEPESRVEPIDDRESVLLDEDGDLRTRNEGEADIEGSTSEEVVDHATVTDGSVRSSREQELLAQKERLEDLIATISHDLRNPLTVAEGNVQLASETGDLSHLDGATQALGRTNDLLDYLERLAEEGMRTCELERVDLREVAEAAWSVVETDGADLDVEEDTMIVGDRQRVQQLLENLFGNAVKHGSTSPRSKTHDDAVKHGSVGGRSPSTAVQHDARPTATNGASGVVVGSPDPEVTVRVGPLDSGGFYVEDDGPGIPVGERSEIFEMGHSGDPGGTGFGLAICRQTVEAHGWSIDVTAGADGGARFEVSGVDPA